MAVIQASLKSMQATQAHQNGQVTTAHNTGVKILFGDHKMLIWMEGAGEER